MFFNFNKIGDIKAHSSFQYLIDIMIILVSGYFLLNMLSIMDSYLSVVPDVYYYMIFLSTFYWSMFRDFFNKPLRGANSQLIIGGIVKIWGGALVLIFFGLFLAKKTNEVSRLWLVSWSILNLFFMISYRLLIIAFLKKIRKQGWDHKSLLLIGEGFRVNDVLIKLEDSNGSGFSPIKKIDFDSLKKNFDDIKNFDEIWLCVSISDISKLYDYLEELRYFYGTVRIVPDLLFTSLFKLGISEVDGINTIEMSSPTLNGSARFFKFFEDFFLSLLFIILSSPLFVIIACLIAMTSKGPVFFVQKRVGFGGKPIDIYKFRTMIVHSEETGFMTQATRNDSRVTWIGRYLRKFSLDELPQLFNVLKGDMSIVGPRPHAVAHNDCFLKLLPVYALRHKVKPGITGLAQISGFRGEITSLERLKGRIKCDLHYINNFSFLLDLQIILKTLLHVLHNDDAY